jgi:hypothetical protein
MFFLFSQEKEFPDCPLQAFCIEVAESTAGQQTQFIPFPRIFPGKWKLRIYLPAFGTNEMWIMLVGRAIMAGSSPYP